MKVRLGYVAIALNLKGTTSSSTLTFSRYKKISSEIEQERKLKEITYSNLLSLEKILNYNIKNNIHFYRISSNLIPLATHPEVLWNYTKYFRDDFKHLGNIIKNNNMRIDFHPDQFNVINSVKDDVVKNTIINLNYQSNILDLMNIKSGKLVIHVGSGQNGESESIDRYVRNLEKIPKTIKNKLIIENDDKVFTVKDVLKICNKTDTPMVLDVHHHNCNNNGENIAELLVDIFKTWDNEELLPKIHFSTPREFINDRKHSDYIDSNDFITFLEIAKNVVNKDFDIMIEAKAKDKALLKLIEEVKILRPNYTYIDESTIEL